MEFSEFAKAHKITLNEQQERAAQVIGGAHLLVAVPGSGKTTVLITRLAYMTMCRNIDPRRILSITYNTAAAKEMQERFAVKFDRTIAEQIDFRTINSLGEMIVRQQLKYKGAEWSLYNGDKEHVLAVRNLFRNIFRSDNNDDISESEIDDVFSEITYIKNAMLTSEEIKNLKNETLQIEKFYNAYQEYLKFNKLYDYDDQILYAISSLKKNKDLLEWYQGRYDYICVDEAQDTSKAQHKLIRILAKSHNNIFMVGDEDQSIYGFRGAYPQALISFKDDYPNANVMYMENNYRSTGEIVSLAGKFIKNSNAARYDKRFIATRENGKPVERVVLARRFLQYSFLLSQIKEKASDDIAILFRNNDCSIPLIDLLIRNNIPYKIRSSAEQCCKFFKHRIVDDIKAFFSLALDPYDYNAFLKIYYKCGLYIRKKMADRIAWNSRDKHMTVCQAFKEQMEPFGGKFAGKAQDFERILSLILLLSPSNAISAIMANGYAKYIKDNELDGSKIEILKALALRETTLQGFMERLDAIPALIKTNVGTDSKAAVTLSTAHSSKGLEFDTVYIFDIYDGIFPNVENREIRLKTEKYYEERRLFYVAMTRAKNRLVLLELAGCKSTFLSELFPPKNEATVIGISSKNMSKHKRANMTFGSSVSSASAASLPASINNYNIGDEIVHRNYGKGRIIEKTNNRNMVLIRVKYDNGSTLSYDLAILLKNNLIEKL